MKISSKSSTYDYIRLLMVATDANSGDKIIFGRNEL